MLYTETIEPDTLGLLRRLSQESYLEAFSLVGGTALALQIGHRRSVDLDFFSTSPFQSKELLAKLEEHFDVTPTTIDNNTLICEIQGIKVDFIRFKYPFQKPFIVEEGIRMLSVYDIAPMKLDAITGRGHKKDFFDLYFLFQLLSIEDIILLYKSMFGHNTIFHVLKSLSYFVDAELNPDPIVMNKAVTWEKVKKRVLEETIAYGKDIS